VKRYIFLFGKYILDSPRYVKWLIAVGFDLFSALITVWLACSLRLESISLPDLTHLRLYLLAPALMLPIFTLFGLYHAIHRYSGFSVFITVGKAMLVYGFAFFSIMLLMQIDGIPRSIGILQPILLFLMTAGSRAMVRFMYTAATSHSMRGRSLDRLLIYGAGSSGAEIGKALQERANYELLGYLDDSKELHGRKLNGIPVYYPGEAERLIQKEGINNVLIAMPSASRTRRNEIIESFRRYPVRIQTLPGVDELADGRVTISDIKEVEIEDLLGRDPVPIDHELVHRAITKKVVLVTGAGGSIGSELCRQLLQAHPATLLLLDNTELNLYTIHCDVEARAQKIQAATRFVPLLCDVTDEERITEICRVFKPEVIYHAAAYKHVPMVEYNPAEGVRNNVFGTLSVVRAAIRQGVSNFVLVSTDKAVRPTNVMGASKRLCEMALQAHAAEQGHKTCFSMVRFGNVLGSSGSVVPLFRRQIKEGNAITITHEEITRYFMTIPEAAQLIIQAGAMATGGDLYLLEMGKPVKIIDLARKMVELSGLSVRDHENPNGDIEIKVTGLRPGEKLYEELLIGNNSGPTANPRIFKAYEEFMPIGELNTELSQLIVAIRVNDVKNIKRILNKIIPEYNPAAETTDLLASETECQICANISRPKKVQSNGKNGKTVKSAELGVMGNGKSGSRTC